MKIRAKKGFNIIIKDLGITLRSEKRDWVDVSSKDYNNSQDIKSFLKFIEIKNDNSLEKDLVEEDVNDNTSNMETAFVREGRVYANPDDVYVRYDQEDVIDISLNTTNDINEEASKESEILKQKEVSIEKEDTTKTKESKDENNKQKNKKNVKNKKQNDSVAKEDTTVEK